MRIIAGQLKGRNIAVPKNFKGRPTTDFAREGVMNMLHHEVDWHGLRVLDLFAGTGALGLECLSRGAAAVTAVDGSPMHVRFIRENFVQFGFSNSKTVCADVFKFIPKNQESFDLILADPPYDIKEIQQLPDIILNSSCLHSESLVVLEHHYKLNFETHPNFQRSRTFSNVAFTFFRKEKLDL
jgi:16S rRNA (guanine966-N2)-methyltransferase